MREALQRDGYVVVPGMFDPGELDRYRAILDEHFRTGGNIFKLGKTQPNAAVVVPMVSDMFHHPRVVAAFRDALGTEDIVFTGHCDLHKGMFSGWHKDTGPRHGYFEDDCFAPDCEVYKIGIYLQDHSHGEGLTVVPGSHHEREIRESNAVTLRTGMGDAVIFDVRITHRGKHSDRLDKLLYRANYAVKWLSSRLRRAPMGKDDLKAAYLLRRGYDVLTGRRRRHSIFFTYGRRNRFTDQFAAANMARQLDQNVSEGGKLPAALLDGLKAERVALSERLSDYV